jgi:hypothetical protein
MMGLEFYEFENEDQPIVLQRRGSEVQRDMDRERKRRKLVVRRRGKGKKV